MSKTAILVAVACLAITQPASAQTAIGQQAVSQIIADGKYRYQTASTELQKTAQRSIRRKAFCDFGAYEVTDWFGVVVDVKSTNEGKAGLSVDMGNFRLVPFDGYFGDTNFVGQSSPIYSTLLGLRRGDKVAFHGRFHKGEKDCFREMSLTENGSMTSPDFLFDFTALTPYR